MTVAPSIQLLLYVFAVFSLLIAWFTHKAQKRVDQADSAAKKDRESLRQERALTQALKAELAQHRRQSSLSGIPRGPQY